MWSRLKRIPNNLYAAYRCWSEDEVGQQAAAVSYYMALSLFPMLIVLFSVASAALRGTEWGQNARQQLIDLVSLQTSPQLGQYLGTIIESAGLSAAANGPLGFGMLIVAAMAVFSQFESAFDRIWRAPQAKTSGLIAGLWDVLRRRFRAFLMLAGVSVFVMIGFVATMTLAAARHYLSTRLVIPPVVWTVSTAAIAIAMNWPLFAAIYKVLPNVEVRWSEAARGAILAAVLWEVGRRLLATVIIGSQYSVYGVVGAFVALMLWFYYAVSVIFFGAEYVQVTRSDSSNKRCNA
jgi:membrane protein